MFRCKHKYGKIEDGFQYCEKCGKAISAPARICSHKYQNKDQLKRTNRFGGSSFVYVMACAHCGDIKKVNSTDD